MLKKILMKHIGIGEKMKKKQEIKELRMMLDSLMIGQEKIKSEMRMLRNALQDFRYKESIKQNKSEFEVMNFE
jgi:hypothetical protein